MGNLTKLIVEGHWGDLASVAGVLISLVGFGITIRSVVLSKRAAEKAQESAQRVREGMLRSDTMVDLSAAVSIMDEIKRLHRASGQWPVLLDRYSALKGLLISIRASSPFLREEHRAALLGAMQQFSTIEESVERALASKRPLKVAALNQIVSDQLDKLNELLAFIKLEIGEQSHGG